MSEHRIIKCSPPWSASPSRPVEEHGVEPRCTRCGCRLSKYRAYTDEQCAPCQEATRIEPQPTYCGCGCGAEVWVDYKGRGGSYLPGHNQRRIA